MEEPLHAFVLGVERREQFATLIRVAKELVDRFLQRILNARTLELGDDQRDAVHEQHRVRDDVPAPAGQLDLELIDDEKVVVRRVFEIDVTCTGCGRPWSQSGKPSATVPLSSSSVADWLISMSRWPAACSRSRIARAMRSSSSHGCPSRKLSLRSAAAEPAFEQHLTKLTRSVDSGTSVSPSIHCQPISLSCSQKGFSHEIVFPLDFHGTAYSSIAFFA